MNLVCITAIKREKIRLAKKENNLSNRIPGGGFYSNLEDMLKFGNAGH